MSKKILVTGARGLVGSAIRRYVETHGSPHEWRFVGRQQVDLLNPKKVEFMFDTLGPDYVIHTAAKVGGIGGNMAGHADYFYENILMNTNVIHECHRHNVKKLLAFSSVCVFPDDVAILREDVMHDGPPFSGNFAYAHTKRMVDVQIRAYKSQYGHLNWCSIIPGNIYGTHDLYNLEHGHVMPALIHKLFLAIKNQQKVFPIWGDGQSLREFVFSDDLADVLVKLLEYDVIPERLIVSGFEQHSIAELVSILVKCAGFTGRVEFDHSKPNGQRNRQSDHSLFKSFFPDFQHTDFNEGVAASYQWFADNYPNVRL